MIRIFANTPSRVFVTVKPRSSKERVERVDASHFIVAVHEPPDEGRANEAVIAALARHLGVPKSRVTIVSGHASRRKVMLVEPGSS
jgi:uncharacterized protein